VAEIVRAADPDAPRPEERASAPLRRERLAEERRVDDADVDLPLALERDRHREERELVDEVDRPVERVDDPPLRRARGPRRAALLRQDCVPGVRVPDPLDDERLGADVRARDEVVALALRADRGRAEPAELLEEDLPGAD